MAVFLGRKPILLTPCAPPSADDNAARAISWRAYGRRHGRRQRPQPAALAARRWPALHLPLPSPPALEKKNPNQPLLAAASLFARPVAAVWLELGFGGGEHLLHQAAQHKDVGFLAAEIWHDGLMRLAARAPESLLPRLRLAEDDGRSLLAALPPALLARADILFPDPWPKLRHRRRRIISRFSLALLRAALKTGGIVRLASDHPVMQEHIFREFAEAPFFRPLNHQPAVFCPPAGHAPTRYEIKALAAGRPVLYFAYQAGAGAGW